MCDTRPVGALSAEADRLEAACAAIVALRPRIEAGAPWPLAELYGPEPEASWGPNELLAHVEEYLPYWLGEIERVLAGDPAAPVPFGRVAEDQVRIGVIGRDRTVPLRELFARIESDAPRVAARLRELSDGEANRVGLHPRRGELAVRDMLEPFLVGHSEGHVTQLREILEAAGK
jgi:DinB family protein